MAILWPRVVPPEILSDRRRKAEIEVFERLKSSLDDSWYVFYSRPWWGLSDRGGELDGEADFIIAHPDRGILFLEVKGGRVEFDGETGKWTSTDRLGVTHKIKDPVNQAKVCKHRFADKLRSHPRWPGTFVRLRHGVVLPDVMDPGRGVSMIAGNPKILFCFEQEFDQSFAGWIEMRLASHESRTHKAEEPPGVEGLEVLTALVAEPVRLNIPLRRMLAVESSVIEELATQQQMFLLTALEQEPRLLISGGAGTGKTILAMEMAARSSSHYETCIICYNEPLATWMLSQLGRLSNITVTTFHSLCKSLVIEAGMRTAESDCPSPTFFETLLPDIAKTALLSMPNRRWDTVIVDEGQDFHPEWWSLIELMVRTSSTGRLRIMYDSNQAVHHKHSDPSESLEGLVFGLRLNLRNTQAIAKATEPFYSGPPIQPIGPVGESPMGMPTPSVEKGIEQAVKLIEELINYEGLAKEDLAVLLPDRALCMRLEKILERHRVKSVTAGRTRDNAVVVDTIRRFKGLESVVIILIVDRLAAENHELCYVAVSRARSRLYVLGDIGGTLLEKALQTT